MPTTRRGSPRRKHSHSLTLAWDCYLRNGLMFGSADEDEIMNGPSVKEMWDQHKKKIMEVWLTHKINAGMRPWTWWKYDARTGNQTEEKPNLASTKGNQRGNFCAEARDLRAMGELQSWEEKEIEKLAELQCSFVLDEAKTDEWPYYDFRKSEIWHGNTV